MADTQPEFEGFDWPSFTQVPRDVFHRFLPQLSGSGFKVLCVIAHWVLDLEHNYEEGYTPMSQTQIADETGLSVRQVRRALQECIEEGAVVLVEAPDPAHGLSGLYSLQFKRDQHPSGHNVRRSADKMS